MCTSMHEIQVYAFTTRIVPDGADGCRSLVALRRRNTQVSKAPFGVDASLFICSSSRQLLVHAELSIEGQRQGLSKYNLIPYRMYPTRLQHAWHTPNLGLSLFQR